MLQEHAAQRLRTVLVNHLGSSLNNPIGCSVIVSIYLHFLS
jgi:hypothetical protein